MCVSVFSFPQRFALRIDTGEHAIDWEQAAKNEHLSDIQVEMRFLQQKLDAVRQEQKYQLVHLECRHIFPVIHYCLFVLQVVFLCRHANENFVTRPNRLTIVLRGIYFFIARVVLLFTFDCALFDACWLFHSCCYFQVEYWSVRAVNFGCSLSVSTFETISQGQEDYLRVRQFILCQGVHSFDAVSQ